MKNINVIIDAVINENNINSLGHRLKKSLPYIDCQNYPNIEKQFKIIMEAKKNAK